MRTDAAAGHPDPVQARGAQASAREATRLVIRCILQGVLVALLMSALEPLSLSVLDMLSGR
jgi:hypothetical protein